MNETVVLTAGDVAELLPVRDCIEVVESALRELADGGSTLPLRSILRVPDVPGVLGLMPSYTAEGEGFFGLKAIAVFPGNPAKGLHSHRGVVMLFSGSDGQLLAMADAAAVTAVRTAAASAVATRQLARSDSSVLAIAGTGVQARAHVEAMAAVLPLRRIRIAGRTGAAAVRFVEETVPMSSVEVEACRSVEEALEGADVVVTATSATEPVLRGEWLRPGMHVNLVGASTPATREADSAVYGRSAIFTDRRESLLNEAGDYLLAVREGALREGSFRGELGEVLAGSVPGRMSREEITVFRSLGIAVEDLAAVRELYRRALERGSGQRVAFS